MKIYISTLDIKVLIISHTFCNYNLIVLNIWQALLIDIIFHDIHLFIFKKMTQSMDSYTSALHVLDTRMLLFGLPTYYSP